MFITNKLRVWYLGRRKAEIQSFAILIDHLRCGDLEQINWEDVDDFFHSASPVKVIRVAGRLCAHIAYRFPGKISGLYSEDALPFLEEISSAMNNSDKDSLKNLAAIKKRVEAAS